MSGRRLLTAAGAALAGVLLAATPASAAEPTVEWTNPTTEEPVMRAPGPITGTIVTNEDDKQGILELRFHLVQPHAAPSPCAVEIPEPERVRTFPDKPPTVNFELPLQIPCNGSYEITATVIYEERLLNLPITIKEVTASMPFKVAIPPARVSGLAAAYDPATKEVRLTWEPNPEPDIRNYRVERNAPGRGGFEIVAEPGPSETGFVDRNIDVEHGYRVFAVREGPDGFIVGRSTLVVSAGPEPPPPSVPRVTSGTRGATGSRSSGGGDGPRVRRRTATTVDTGFSQNLPFDPSQTTSTLPVPSTEPGQAAVLAEFDDGEDDRRATLVPIAGGLALLMSAVHVRLLSKRVGDDDIPILPGS